jgi:hypothetical protein
LRIPPRLPLFAMLTAGFEVETPSEHFATADFLVLGGSAGLLYQQRIGVLVLGIGGAVRMASSNLTGTAKSDRADNRRGESLVVGLEVPARLQWNLAPWLGIAWTFLPSYIVQSQTVYDTGGLLTAIRGFGLATRLGVTFRVLGP